MIVSPLLIADVSKTPPDWVVPKQFLLGLGRPWELYPWEYSTSGDFRCFNCTVFNLMVSLVMFFTFVI